MSDFHQAKRPRYMDAWEASLGRLEDAERGQGLSELFGGSHPSGNLDSQGDSSTETSFFTLRLEHQTGGAVAGGDEERILLFRSDRPGAIAKIVYSSSPSPCDTDSSRFSEKRELDEECELREMAQAKIHVLDVKEQYRGYDFGGLLFTEAVTSLQHQYRDENLKQDPNSDNPSGFRRRQLMSSVRCQLDAEEDIRRHNRLVGFYERLGCKVKPKAKVRYLNNNDGETYRRVPMQIALPCENAQASSTSGQRALVSRNKGFVPVLLCDSGGNAVTLQDRGSRLDWLMLEDGEGSVEFVTTKGCYLRVNSEGDCSASKGEPSMSSTDEVWSKFRALQLCDFSGPDNNDNEKVPEEARSKQLWLLKSAHGTFLSLDAVSRVLTCTKKPAFWQAGGESFKLTFSDDTPARRRHYREHWTKQTVAYINAMKSRYLSFDRKQMSLREALDLVGILPGEFFSVERSYAGISLRTLGFRTAEFLRNAGHPDWLQLIALVYGLAGVLKCVDVETAASCADNFDWTLPARSRVVGCASPSSVVFGEFHSLNDDERDPRYQSEEGVYQHQCGLDNVMLTWSGPEYMYHMLKHNGVFLPEEGFRVLRLASLSDWHTRGVYSHLADESDLESQALIADFDECYLQAKAEARVTGELSVEECDRLWLSHYSSIAAKYNANEQLAW